MSAAVALWWRLRSASTPNRAGSGGAIDRLAVAAYAVAAAALLITSGGVHAFLTRSQEAGEADGGAGVYVGLAITAAALLVVPILTLGGVAARLSLGRRNERLATLRLAGATSGQVSAMVLAESAAQALTGGVLGAGLYAASIPGLTLLTFQGRHLTPGELWLGFGPLLLLLAVILALAVFSGLVSLAAVVVGPLGVARRTTPGRLRVWRLVVAAGVLVVWLFGTRLLGELGFGALVAVLAAVVAAVNLVGPWFVQVAGRVYAGLARSAAGLIAARRIVDDPRATWRSVSALGLAICVAALSSVGGSPQMGDPSQPYLAVDLGTGALVALVIVTVVAATSTGIVQTARVVDQRDQYRALALAGTPAAVLHGARSREVWLPMAVTMAAGGFLPLLILLPAASLMGPGIIVRTLSALAVSVLLMGASVQASRGLVTRYAEPGAGRG